MAELAGAGVSRAERKLALLFADLAEQLHAAAGEVLKGDLALLIPAQLAHDLCHRVLHVQLPAHHKEVVPFGRTGIGRDREEGGQKKGREGKREEGDHEDRIRDKSSIEEGGQREVINEEGRIKNDKEENTCEEGKEFGRK